MADISPWVQGAGVGASALGAGISAYYEEQERRREEERKRKEFEELQKQNALGQFNTSRQLGMKALGMMDEQIAGARSRANSPSFRSALRQVGGA
jgi:hypothetical protein